MELFYLILDFIKQWYWIPLLILYLGVIITILIENRNPSKTISWVLVIAFLPFLGLILYYLFGQKYIRIKRIKRENRIQELRLRSEWNKFAPYMERDLALLNSRIGNLSRVFRFLKNEKLSSPTLGNKVQLLINGEQKFNELLNAIHEAELSIHLEYYIFELDNIGAKILELLEQKANEGIKVRILVDSIGSSELKKYFSKRKNTKIKFLLFMPVTFTSLANSNYRNHRKMAIIDGKIGFIGGINISDRYINSNDNHNSLYWRDTSVKIIGNGVLMMQIGFWNSWNLAGGEPYQLKDGYLVPFDEMSFEGEAAVTFVSSDPGSAGPYNMEAILIAIGEADKKIQLVTPYYIPSDEIATALKVAAAAGIQVELMLPRKSDSYIVQHASLSFIKPLLERGVKVFFYDKGFIHAKTVNVDGKLSFIGTVNLDIRSFYINYEVAAVVSDNSLCQQLEEQFELDKKNCVEMTLAEWKKRSAWKRGLDSICRLLAPLL